MEASLASPPAEGYATQEMRVLVCCPTGRDAALVREALEEASIETLLCTTVEDVCRELGDGAGAILVAQEALSRTAMATIRKRLDCQEKWSDVPVIVLRSQRHALQDPRNQWLLEMLPSATVLARPVQKDLLVRAIQVCLRTRRRQYQLRAHLQEREAMLNALETANAAKDEFLGLISHELRTPATTISGGAKILRRRGKKLAESDRDELMLGIDEEADRLCIMIENLLLVSRADSVDLREPTLVQRGIEHSVDAFRHVAARQIRVSAPPDLPPAICNAELFEHVMNNLLTNADKYTANDEPIDISAWARPGAIELVVADRGRGVAPDELDRIFERFYRNSDAARTARGLGLGLTVCRRLLDSQGGRIWATPREGGGLEVHVLLPLAGEA
jgi:signal transduction histidine kinase